MPILLSRSWISLTSGCTLLSFFSSYHWLLSWLVFTFNTNFTIAFIYQKYIQFLSVVSFLLPYLNVYHANECKNNFCSLNIFYNINFIIYYNFIIFYNIIINFLIFYNNINDIKKVQTAITLYNFTKVSLCTFLLSVLEVIPLNIFWNIKQYFIFNVIIIITTHIT